MINQELDVSLLLVLNDALESIRSCRSRRAAHREQLARRAHAIANFYLGHRYYLAAHASVKSCIQVTVNHASFVGERSLHRVRTPYLVLYRGAVALNLLTLERSTLAADLLALKLQYRSHRHYSLFLHVLLWEDTTDSSRYLTTYFLERSRSDLKVVRTQIT